MPSLIPVFFALSALVNCPQALAEPLFVPTIDRQRELTHLVRQDCGSCHGLTLHGGLGPSLRASALKDKPIEALVATIYRGRPGTPMPPWQQFISENESRWIVEQLLGDGFLEKR
ncbi:MAG TPA: cytochrome c [Accumulibacter sp.]|nr:cytochrome c [Accumulibacter sp.]HMW17316.1 cytochrome c [Accumulibacter sp.]HMX21716.1 cytochrome c [Accumulibacter sp.]HMY06184.1 cytochrome c [Accumulibacter sp.]HNC17511.1 cytochrome c [Accumulibacter sp.]